MTHLGKSSKWYIWNPKRGRYKGRTVYVALVNSPMEDRRGGYGYVYGAILAFESKKTHELTMHKGQISEYQFKNNTLTLRDNDLIGKLEKLYEDYKPKWEEMRLIKDAKRLLLNVKNRSL